MVVSNATNVTVEANSVTGSGNDGLLLLNADDGTFQANDISSNGRFGVLLVSGSDHNTIRDNSLNGNGAPASGAGLGVVGGTDTQILRNTAQGNRLGITVHTGSNVVQGNIANANQTVGITIADVAGDNRVDGNTATGNGAFDLTDVNAHCGTNSWQNGVFSTDDVAGVPDDGPGAGCITGVTSLACVDGACPSDAKAVLLAQTGAVDVTGPLPELGRVRGPVTVGEVTLEGRGLFVGVAGDRRVDGGDWTSLLAGPDIALTGRRKVLNIAFPVPVFTAGFDFVEPETVRMSGGASATRRSCSRSSARACRCDRWRSTRRTTWRPSSTSCRTWGSTRWCSARSRRSGAPTWRLARRCWATSTPAGCRWSLAHTTLSCWTGTRVVAVSCSKCILEMGSGRF